MGDPDARACARPKPSDLRASARARPSGRRAAAMSAMLALAVLTATTGCARKNDPVPPTDATRSPAPQLIAPGEVTQPIRDLEDD